MLRSNLCDYADAYILLKGTITITGAGDDDAAKRLDERMKRVICNPISTRECRFRPPFYTFINNFLFTSAFFVKFSDFSKNLRRKNIFDKKMLSRHMSMLC